MSTPLQRDGDTATGAQTSLLAFETADEGGVEAARGFADAAPGFSFDAPVSALDADRRKVEGLLRDAGVATPSVLPSTLPDVVPVDHAPSKPGLLPARPSDRLLKRTLDVTLSMVAIILLAPLLALIALAIRAEGGPTFFFQTRVGRNRERFTCVKFRTMRPDAEDRLKLLLACNDGARAEWNKHQKLIDDPRVTPLGRILRESSLDELPQLINVLRGEMSLVGPRPIVAPEVDGFDADRAYFGSAAFDDYAACLPGITGLWQISGRHKMIYLERVRLDRKYARTWSFWLDLKIIWKTVGVVLRRSGR